MQVHELIDPNTTVRDAAIAMRDQDIGSLPVGENDRLVGDVSRHRGSRHGRRKGPLPRPRRDVRWHLLLSGGNDAQRGSEIMVDHKVRRLPVLSEDKRLAGMVSLADLARAGVGQNAMHEVSQPTAAERL